MSKVFANGSGDRGSIPGRGQGQNLNSNLLNSALKFTECRILLVLRWVKIHTHTHTHTHRISIMIKMFSLHGSPSPLSLSLSHSLSLSLSLSSIRPYYLLFQQVLKMSSGVCIELKNSFAGRPNPDVFICVVHSRIYVFVLAWMICDGRQVAVQPLFCGLLLLEFVSKQLVASLCRFNLVFSLQRFVKFFVKQPDISTDTVTA